MFTLFQLTANVRQLIEIPTFLYAVFLVYEFILLTLVYHNDNLERLCKILMINKKPN